MKTFFLNAAFAGLRWYVTSGIFDRIAALVLMLIDEDIPGDDKKKRVIEFVEGEYGKLWGKAQEIVLDGIIALTRLKAKQAAGEIAAE